jgi:hypothetical protein
LVARLFSFPHLLVLGLGKVLQTRDLAFLLLRGAAVVLVMWQLSSIDLLDCWQNCRAAISYGRRRVRKENKVGLHLWMMMTVRQQEYAGEIIEAIRH